MKRMNSQAGNKTKDEPLAESERPFRLLTIFDSAESNAEAASASRLVLGELGEDVPVDRNAWDIRLLDSPILRERAAEQAALADVIVLALSAREPSEPLRQWMEAWQKNRALDGGLLALIPEGDAEGQGGLAEYVSGAALTANMDFLCRKQPRF